MRRKWNDEISSSPKNGLVIYLNTKMKFWLFLKHFLAFTKKVGSQNRNHSFPFFFFDTNIQDHLTLKTTVSKFDWNFDEKMFHNLMASICCDQLELFLFWNYDRNHNVSFFCGQRSLYFRESAVWGDDGFWPNNNGSLWWTFVFLLFFWSSWGFFWFLLFREKTTIRQKEKQQKYVSLLVLSGFVWSSKEELLFFSCLNEEISNTWKSSFFLFLHQYLVVFCFFFINNFWFVFEKLSLFSTIDWAVLDTLNEENKGNNCQPKEVVFVVFQISFSLLCFYLRENSVN